MKILSTKQFGFALIEVLIAVTIMSGSMLVVVSAANKSLIYSHSTLKNYQASLAIEETIEAVKAIRAEDWDTIAGLTSGESYGIVFVGGVNWEIAADPEITSLGFTRSITLEDVYRDSNDDIASSGTLDTGTKKITANVTWSENGTPHSQSVIFYITNIL